ncbi:MAG: hypothetical protein ACRD2M_08985 [Terriglobales bacterium]
MEVIFLIALVAWPLSAYSPVPAKEWYLNRKAAQEIPIYPGAEIQKRFIETIANSDGCGGCVELTLRAPADKQQLQQFYATELSRRGWERISASEAETASAFLFHRQGSIIRIHIVHTPEPQTSTQFSVRLNP